MASFKFQCPQCGRSFKANKDLGGRLKRCGQCRGTFTIRRTAPAKAGAPAKPEPLVLHDPELAIDQVFAALQEYRKTSPSLPSAFAAEATFGSFEPVHRITLEATFDTGKRDVAHRETLSYPTALAELAKGGRRVVDLRFDHTSQLAGLLADKPQAVREAAEKLAKEHRPPAGAKFAGRRLVVDHLQLWGTQWAWHGLEGEAWFYGKPLRVHLPKPPKRSGAPAVLATLAALAGLGAVGWVLWEFDLIRPGERPAPAPAPRPAPVAVAPPRPATLTFAKDGLLQADDGSFLRGSLERKGSDVVVSRGGDVQSVPPWKIESLHVEASVFLRGEARRLDELEAKVKDAKSASREALVGLFLEIHRQSDRWTPLIALCGPGELPRDPLPRLEAMRVEVGRLLEAPVAAAPTAPGAPAKVEVNPAIAVANGLLAQLRTAADRPALAAKLQALRPEKLAQSELLEIAAAWLSRSEEENGLATDRVVVKTPQYEGAFDGQFEKRNEGFAKLRTAAGTDVTVYREGAAWTAILPGGLTLQGAAVTMAPQARTVTGEKLKASIDRLPPERWMTAPAAEHLKAAKAVEPKTPLLRTLAASHAATALRTGTPSEILEARVFLHELGYAQGADGRWERPEERRAAQMGRLLADGKPEDARAMLPGGKAADFASAYRAAALPLLSPIRSVEELARATSALDAVLPFAVTPGQSKHLLALKGSVSGYGICSSCGSNPAKICATCRGKGTRTEACVRCHGLGYIAAVGIGATGSKTCDGCGGKPIKGTRPCEHCAGTGKRSCAKCQGQTKLPQAGDLARTRPCAPCGGSGTRGEGIVHGCASCAGLGVQLVPAAAPDATLP